MLPPERAVIPQSGVSDVTRNFARCVIPTSMLEKYDNLIAKDCKLSMEESLPWDRATQSSARASFLALSKMEWV